MFSRLTALVGGGPQLPFELGEPASSAWAQWQLYHGTLRADGSPVSVFCTAAQPGDPKLGAARNCVKRLRTLRHPNVLVFKDAAEAEERGEMVVYLVTEPVQPLGTVLGSIGVHGPERNQWIAMGLSAVTHALSFLNNDCSLVHGHICLGAVVVTDTLDWKLAGFDLTTDHQWPQGGSAVLAGEVPLTAASWMVGAQYKPGEVARSEWQVVRESPPWAVDAWGLGCLMQELYSGAPLQRTEDLRRTDCIPKDVLPHYQRLLASQPARRLNPARLLEAGVLRNRLAETMGFLENLAIKDAVEKDTFFKRLPSLLKSIPEPVAQRKLLPMLAGALEFGGAPPVALTTLLQARAGGARGAAPRAGSIGETLNEADHARLVVPIITKLFASSDRGIRRGLLENIFTFGPGLPDKLVEEQIYGHVAGGFTDGNPYLRELTLKSMAVDEEPSIRANTTVLLGNLAPHLGEATCKKVLLNAFSRALKDQFPPARVAGLKAIVATAQYYSPEDAAARIVPAIGPLCCDAVHEVRASALACLAHCVTQLREHHAALEKRAAEAAAADGAAAAEGGAPGAPAGGSLLGSFGWAVSSLGLSRGAEAPKPDASAGPPKAISSSTPPSSYASHTGGSSGSAAASPRRPSSSSDRRPAASAGGGGWREEPAAAPGAAAEGWADDDDPLEDMLDAAAAEREARQKLSRAAVGRGKSLAAVRGAPHAPPPPPPAGGGWDGGDGDWQAPGGGAARPAASRRPQGHAMKLGASKSKLGAAKAKPDEDW
eukprot:scaffold6.g2497.t1